MPDADQVLPLLGRYAQDPAVEELFNELKTRRRPELDRADRDSYNDFVLVRRQGLELGFVDEAFFLAAPPEQRREKGVPLLMHQAYFYNDVADISRFSGKLPFNLEWSDNRESAREKLAEYESRRRPYVKDCWKLPQFNITVEYKEKDGTLLAVLCQLPIQPWPEEGRVQPTLSIADWSRLFGFPVTSPVLREALQPLNLTEVIETCDDAHEIDFRFACGLQMVFTKLGNLTLKANPALMARTEPVLGAVTFFRSRHFDAREWKGELPFQLSFEDTPVTIVDKMGCAPDQRNDDPIVGSALWRLGDYDLHIQYSVVENHLTQISLMAPGYRK